MFEYEPKTKVYAAHFYRNDPSECNKPIRTTDLDQAKELIGERLLEMFNSPPRGMIRPTMASIHDEQQRELFTVRVISRDEYREVSARETK